MAEERRSRAGKKAVEQVILARAKTSPRASRSSLTTRSSWSVWKMESSAISIPGFLALVSRSG